MILPTRPIGSAHGAALPGLAIRRVSAAYFNELLIEENLLLSLVPSPFTIAMMASEMPAAISPYSMAVAPDSSVRNLRSVFIPATWGQKTKAG